MLNQSSLAQMMTPPELLGIQQLNPYHINDSPSRQTMFGGQHIGQALVIGGSTVRRDPSGMERKYGKYTHSIKMPCDAIIRKCIHMYPQTITSKKNAINPLVSIVYETQNKENLEIGIIHLENYHCLHQHFGFNYVWTKRALSLRIGDRVREGEILARSPSVTEDGEYKYGIESQIALMTIPQVIEDGCVARRGHLENMKTRAYGRRVCSWGKSVVPLNLYGDDENYRPFPDIGDTIRPDGLLFATREYDEIMAVVNMTNDALKHLDHFDKPTYAIPNARVIDIEVHHGRVDRPVTLVGMNDQCAYYYNRSREYHQEIVDTYKKLCKDLNGRPPLSPEMQNSVEMALGILDQGNKTKVLYLMNDVPLDEWMVVVKFEYILTPGIGFKITDTHGGKVIIVDVWDDEDMPLDCSGNRADFIQDPAGTDRRMNVGRSYEQYIKASMRMTNITLDRMVADGSPASYEAATKYLYDYYDLLSPMFANVNRNRYGGDLTPHIKKVANGGLRVWMPVDNPVVLVDVIPELAKRYPAPYGPVTYRGRSGRMVTTRYPVLIGSMYIMLLEKVGNTWSAVSSAKLQHFGVPSKISAIDKYASPGRKNPGRFVGETEGRLLVSTCGPLVVAELFDQVNNIAAHRAICNNILKAPQATNIDRVIDRTQIPRDGGRIVRYIGHFLECAGTKFTYGDPADANNFVEKFDPYTISPNMGRIPS